MTKKALSHPSDQSVHTPLHQGTDKGHLDGTYECRSIRATASAKLTTGKEAKSDTSKPRTGKTKKCFFAFFSGLFKTLHFLASVAAVLLVFYLIFQLKLFTDKFKTVMELKQVIGNLKNASPVIQLQLTDAEMQEANGIFSKSAVAPSGSKTFKVSYFNAGGELEDDEAAPLVISGKNIYVDCDVYNFTYSLIETGEAKNFAVPYRIYSDTVAPENGILLHAKNKQGIPFSLLQTADLGDQQFYELENKRLSKLMDIVNDPARAESLGIIRTRQKAAVANYADMRLGRIYVVKVENTGGLTLTVK